MGWVEGAIDSEVWRAAGEQENSAPRRPWAHVRLAVLGCQCACAPPHVPMVNERNFRSAPASTLPGSTPRHAPPTKTETKTASIEGRSERARAKNSRDRSEGNVSGARYYGVCENGARTCFSGAREGASEKSGFSAHSLIRSFAPSLSCSRLPAILARDSAGAGRQSDSSLSAPPPPSTTTTTICSCCVSWSAAR